MVFSRNKKYLSKKKLTEQDKKDWTEFVEDNSKVPDKDLFEKKDDKKKYKFKFDFHGYSIIQANEKIYEIINDCISKNISEILIITGKGIHSTSENNVYVSEELSKLRNTIQDFIKNNTELSSKILSINEADKFSGGAGAIIIKLKVKV